MDDRAYREVLKGWELLLRRKRAIDDLWAWQAQSWTDFCVLAVTLSLHALEEAELIAQSPILWNGREPVTGRWFSQDNPVAVFWLRESGRIVEVQARPRGISTQQALTKAHVWLRISEPNSGELPRRVPVWTPHCFAEHDVIQESEGALTALLNARRVPSPDAKMRQGLVMMQAHGRFFCHDADKKPCLVRGIALDAMGEPLSQGMRVLGEFVRGTVSREPD